MKFDPSSRVGEIFDLKDGSFSIMQNNLLTAYLSLKGIKGSIACTLLNRVTSGVYFEVSKEKTEDGISFCSRSGTIWSEPSTVDDIVYDMYPFFKNESTYKSTRNNVQKILNEIIDQRLFYRFGKNNFYAYTYEKNFISWKYLFDGDSFVYPHTLKKILNSESDLWTLFLNGSKDGDGKQVFSLDDFFYRFAKFVDSIIGDLPLSVMSRFDRLEKYGKRARLFLDDCRSISLSLGDYEGFSDDGSCKMSRLPASLAEKFSDIIPKEELPGHSPPRANSSRGSVYRAKRNMGRLSEAYQIADEALCIVKDPSHLMVYFERRLKESLGISHDLAIFRNISQEMSACVELFDLLVGLENGESFLRDWIRWYIRNNGEKILHSNGFIIRGLKSSYESFARSKSDGVKAPRSSIFEEMESEYRVSVDIEGLCRKHGVFDTYNFIFVVEGESEATKHFDHFYEYVDELVSTEKRELVIAVMRATFNEKFPDFGYLINKEHKVVRKLQELASQFSKDLRIMTLKVMDREHFDFKERIKYEYTRRKTSGNKQPG